MITYCDIQDGVSGWGVGNINETPLFKNASLQDFHLTADSPCIDAGYNLENYPAETDFEGDKRILDSDGDNTVIVDMGADEFTMIRFVPDTLSAATGGPNQIFLFAGSDDAQRTYLILGCTTGTEPGTLLPQGNITLPLDWDLLTDFIWVYKNSSLFQGFLGTLDADGKGFAQVNIGPLPPECVGIIVYFAFTCNKPFNLASHPVQLEVVP